MVPTATLHFVQNQILMQKFLRQQPCKKPWRPKPPYLLFANHYLKFPLWLTRLLTWTQSTGVAVSKSQSLNSRVSLRQRLLIWIHSKGVALSKSQSLNSRVSLRQRLLIWIHSAGVAVSKSQSLSSRVSLRQHLLIWIHSRGVAGSTSPNLSSKIFPGSVRPTKLKTPQLELSLSCFFSWFVTAWPPEKIQLPGPKKHQK